MLIEIGRKYQDRITGFAGLAVGHVDYISGCNQTLLQPRVKDDGSFQEANWFDDQRLESISTPAEKLVLDNGPSPGFDKPAPKR